MTFGQRLREERKRLGLTQGSAASLCGISKKTWLMYERGASSPSLLGLASTGIDVAYVLSGQRCGTEPLAALYAARAALTEVDNQGLRAAALASLDAAIKKATQP